MAKDKLTDYDSTASNNLDVGGISVAEGMLPSGVNNAIRELMSHQADAFGAGTPLYVDQTNNRLGVGTAAPSSALNVVGDQAIFSGSAGTANIGLQIKANAILAIPSAQTQGYIASGSSAIGVAGDLLIAPRTSAAANIRFITGTSPEEAARLDASGNLLVAKTASNVANVGFEAKSDGAHFMTRDGGEPLKINRLTNDGYLIAFAKDGTTVGSIGADSGDLTIDGGASHTGLRFVSSYIQPRLNGSVSNGGVDLGTTVARFKDLYLSGGVYLGGTGSANLLDDYEEGTWTPEVRASSGTVLSASTKSGHYTKIGRLVQVNCDVTNIVTSGATSSDPIRIYNIPFTADTDFTFGACISSLVTFQSSRTQLVVRSNTGNFIEFMVIGSGVGLTNVDVQDLVSGSSDFYFSITYYTDQ